jgi:hypothetical protein
MRFVALLGGGLLLVWPAALNLYPLVFIDTVSYLFHSTAGETPWDKTAVYGPLLHLFHWQWSLWPAVLAQGLAASWLLWLAQRAVRGGASAAMHLLVCGGLAALTAAPWFLATLMPDALTALAPLALFLLGFGRLSRGEALAVGGLATLAIAAHLSHLPTALALLALTLLLTRRIGPTLRVAAPLALALLLLGSANLIGFGRFTLSPHGAVFLLARLQDDGPAVATLRARCPEAGWHLCGFLDRLPMDSDEFLWDGTSPLNREADGSPRAMGGMRGAAEAGQIVAATLADHPWAVARAALGNAARQAMRVRVGDTLGDTHLALSARRPIALHFPAEELARFDAGLQMRGLLPAAAAPFLWPHLPVLGLALAASLLLLVRAARARDLPRGALILFALVALAANAVATGALSKPHHRYEARIVWLLPAAGALALLPRRRALAAQ